jgi:Holliday junction resolvase RusA-like endonuclease
MESIRIVIMGEGEAGKQVRVSSFQYADKRTGEMRNGIRAYTPSNITKYKNRAAAAAGEAMNGRPPLEGAVAISLYLEVPIPRSWSAKKQAAARAGLIRPTTRPDLSNLAAVLEDALNTIVYRDDSQITDHAIPYCKRYGDRPRCEITVTPVVADSHFPEVNEQPSLFKRPEL